ncbi:hypothetical protein GCM10011491_46860 [Brucella endophytica]|uniref:Uncharacterized protein n=1 Tax=Brucella endophytica TaxID=1963359 RepID=A0A916SSC2_9HYPH|nr:hypothetical protein [Brucella endophytica]GGB13814.1 hypothetical protein GCM10011491_46860 [Brucella endophytica]
MSQKHHRKAVATPGTSTDPDDMIVRLSFSPTSPSPPADGTYNNTATAELTTTDFQFLPNYWIEFHVEDGDATFKDPDLSDETGQTATRQVESDGLASVLFADTKAETQNMKATVVKTPGGALIANGANDTKPFSFT